MKPTPEIHLCIQQPVGYVHSLGLLDPARYFRFQFKRLGARVSLAKNRLRHDAVNFVFGAHLGFDAAQRERHACVFVNLEQLGEGGAQVSADYLQLLASSAVVDYNEANRAAYANKVDDVPVVPLLYAPYLKPEHSIALEERPIDLLFIGCMNERRRAWLDRIEALGLSVAMFDGPLYGPERDQFIMQAKAVVNAHYYESSRFEQARVAHCLSLGTPVIAERTARTEPHAAFEDCVLWLEGAQLEQFFSEDFGTPGFYQVARDALQRFEQADPIEAYAELFAFAAGFGAAHHERRPQQAWRPERIHLGSGKDYKPGWLNLDVLDRAEPDLVLDLGQPREWPACALSRFAGPVYLERAAADIIYANNVLEHVPDLPRLMGNCLELLKTGGRFVIEVPYEHAQTAWQDPTHLRALNEKSWVYYAEWFWYLGWFEHRFQVQQFGYLDIELRECAQDKAAFMRVTLEKVETTPRERMVARTMSPDLMLPDDPAEPVWPGPSVKAEANAPMPQAAFL
jgi:SAM-dependent methyltransferase